MDSALKLEAKRTFNIPSFSLRTVSNKNTFLSVHIFSFEKKKCFPSNPDYPLASLITRNNSDYWLSTLLCGHSTTSSVKRVFLCLETEPSSAFSAGTPRLRSKNSGVFVGVFPVRYIFMIFGVKANFKYFSRKYFTVIYDPGLPSRPFLTFPAPAPTSTLKHVILVKSNFL